MLTPALLVAAALAAAPVSAESGVKIGDTQRTASLTQGTQLESHWKPSQHSMLRLIDDINLQHTDLPMPLDQGGGVSSDLRQILALILGFIPGFGLGHLIARDKSGFILFLIIDIVLWVVGGFVGGFIFHWGPWWGVGGLVWLVVHIIQALDAYGSAGGERLINVMRERAVRFAGIDDARPIQPVTTTRIFEYTF